MFRRKSSGKEKKERNGQAEMICMAVAFLLLLGLVLLNFVSEQAQKEKYSIVCLGDSIIGNVRDDTSITALLEEQLDVAVYNGAFGGTTMACLNRGERASLTADYLSMAELAKAIALQDFGVQNASVTGWAPMDYFPESMYGFQRIDFDEVEILVIEHGVNDYLSGVPLDNPEDPYDVHTFGGALRYSLEALQEAYPKLRIVLSTPIYCWYVRENVSCEERDFGGGLLEEYVNLELEIAQSYGVEVLDQYHDSGIGSSGLYEEWQVYTEDGVHLNEPGRRLIAARIAEVIDAGE